MVDTNPITSLIDSAGSNIRYKNLIMDLDSNTGPVSLGTYCVSDAVNKYRISLLAGKDKGARFIGCDRELQFEVKCDSLEPKDCCEGLSVETTTYATDEDPFVAEYCTKLNIGTGFDSDCIYGVTMGNGDYKKTIESLKNTPIDFTAGSGKEYILCTRLLNCSPTIPPGSQIQLVKMQFLGRDGTVICEIEVPVLMPCIYSSLADFELNPPTGGPAKSANDKEGSKTYESESFKVTVWPNPTSGELNVEIDSKVDTEVDINFISNIGASITNENGVTINKGVNEKTYNLKNYSSGVYYLQINGKDGNIVLPIMLNK